MERSTVGVAGSLCVCVSAPAAAVSRTWYRHARAEHKYELLADRRNLRPGSSHPYSSPVAPSGRAIDAKRAKGSDPSCVCASVTAGGDADGSPEGLVRGDRTDT